MRGTVLALAREARPATSLVAKPPPGSATHLDSLAHRAHLAQAPLRAPASLDLLLLAIEPQAVGPGRVLEDAGGGEGAEVVLRERDREGRVGREDQRGVALAPAASENE